jgi:hypothetical protein
MPELSLPTEIFLAEDPPSLWAPFLLNNYKMMEERTNPYAPVETSHSIPRAPSS